MIASIRVFLIENRLQKKCIRVTRICRCNYVCVRFCFRCVTLFTSIYKPLCSTCCVRVGVIVVVITRVCYWVFACVYKLHVDLCFCLRTYTYMLCARRRYQRHHRHIQCTRITEYLVFYLCCVYVRTTVSYVPYRTCYARIIVPIAVILPVFSTVGLAIFNSFGTCITHH